jgi:hypothetical protein
MRAAWDAGLRTCAKNSILTWYSAMDTGATEVARLRVIAEAAYEVWGG